LVGRQRHLRPQLVDRQPLQQRGALVRGAIEPATFGAPDDEEVVEQPSLRRQQRPEERLAGGQRLDVLGQEALQEAPPVLAGDRDQRPGFERRDAGCCRHVANVAAPPLERQEKGAYRWARWPPRSSQSYTSRRATSARRCCRQGS